MRAFFSAAVAVAVLTTAAFADDALAAALQSRYDALKAATASHDGQAVAAFLEPDFHSIDVQGQSEDAAQMIDEIGQLPPDPNRSSQTHILSASQNGDVATVEQRYEMQTTRTGPDGVPHPITLAATSIDTWVSRDHVWLLRSSITEEMTLNRDGQVVVHRVAQRR